VNYYCDIARLGTEGDSGGERGNPLGMAHDRATLEEPGQPAARSRPETSARPSYVVGPRGDIITLADLPPPHITRWVIRRKAEIVLAVHGGLLSLDEACKRYQLTAEEFATWQHAIEQHGILGLRATHVRDHRHSDKG
jgi:hypothetical protein